MSKFLDSQGLSVLWDLINNKFSTKEELQKVIIKGYYYNGEFYVSSAHTEKYIPYPHKLYIDISTGNYKLYVYNSDLSQYIAIKEPLASGDAAGVMKLYNTLGKNTDGTVTQKAITEELEKKIEVSVEGDVINFFSTTI